ncbi:MAG: C40 family peptidase [Thermoleophilia bacterium]|nr:C40 family peptidase [Thermoleophilia bacterium]
MAQIHDLDASVERTVEDYNAARVRLDEIREKERENRRHLELARSNSRQAQAALQQRLLALYTSASPTALEIILGAESLDDLLSRADAVSRFSEQDARIVRELRAFRAEIKRRKAELAKARAAQEAAVAELARKRQEIEGQLAERRRLLSSIKSEIARIEAAERRRQERLAAQARERVRASVRSSQPASEEGSEDAPGADVGGGSEVASQAAPPPTHGGVVGVAMRYLGTPYRWGGSSPSTGFDCSGFTMYVFAQVGVSLPHSAAGQYGYGAPVSRSALQPGDLVFFNGLGHVGIYVGGNAFIHSPHTGDVVKISSMTGWYTDTYVGARRI